MCRDRRTRVVARPASHTADVRHRQRCDRGVRYSRPDDPTAPAHGLYPAHHVRRPTTADPIPSHHGVGEICGRPVLDVTGRALRRAHRRASWARERGVYTHRAQCSVHYPADQLHHAALAIRAVGPWSAGGRFRVAGRVSGRQAGPARRAATHHSVRAGPCASRHHR